MAETPSRMMALGTPAPDFRLLDTNGGSVSLRDFKDAPALLVMFICNHCPFVRHVAEGIASMCREYEGRGVAVVAVNSNDVSNYPDDGPEKMTEEKRARRYTFPYLYDESQDVAGAYGAACTPDFFLFDGNRRLAYRGRMDGSRPGNGVPVTGGDLRAAMDEILSGKPVSGDQKPSIGCNIKWKPGNTPDDVR